LTGDHGFRFRFWFWGGFKFFAPRFFEFLFFDLRFDDFDFRRLGFGWWRAAPGGAV